MKLRIAIVVALSYLLVPPLVNCQVASINVPDTRWVKIGGDRIFYLDLNDPAQGVSRWASAHAVDVIFPLENVNRRLARPAQLFAIYADASAQLFVCYAERPTGRLGTPRIVIGRIDTGNNSVTELWSNTILLPRQFVVAPSGLIYVLGLAMEPEGKLLDPKNSSPVSADIFHVVDPRRGIIRSLLPVTIQAGRKGGILGLLARSSIAIRRNGNILPFFDPVFAQGEFDDLLEPREYSADGSLVHTHNYPSAPAGSAVSSIQVDRDDSLLIQYMTIGKQPTDVEFVKHIIYGKSVIIRSPLDGRPPSKLTVAWPNEERLIGIRATGELVTENRGKKTINIWKQDGSLLDR